MTNKYHALKNCHKYVRRHHLYIPCMYRYICEKKQNVQICKMFGIEPTTSCILSSWLYNYANSVKSLVI